MHPPDLEARLLAYLESIVPPSGITLTPDTELFSTGLFDSLTLLLLALWVETEIGRPLDPQGLQMETEWATVAGISRFIARERGSP